MSIFRRWKLGFFPIKSSKITDSPFLAVMVNPEASIFIPRDCGTTSTGFVFRISILLD